MKKLIFLAIAAFAVCSCQKNPDMGELSYDYMVYTTYNPAIFPETSGTRVFVPSFINEVKQDGTVEQWNDTDATAIIQKFTEQLTQCGFVVQTDAVGADMNLDLAYVNDVTYYYTGYDPYYWWWDYWGSGYWPGWYYPYPYSYVFMYSVSSLTAELVMPGVLGQDDSDPFPVYWNAFIGGYDYGSKTNNAPYILQGVPRAFSQSPYLKTVTPL